MTAEDRIDRQFAKLLVADADGAISHLPRAALASLFQRGDLVVANDAATLPASLQGVHRPTGKPIEARLAGWVSFRDPTRFIAVAFSAGDHRVPTEDRPPPPLLSAGDRLEFGPLIASVEGALNHPRLVHIRFAGHPASVVRGLVQHGRPIQYAHVPEPLKLRDVWMKIAADPIAFEAPSAGFALDRRTLKGWREEGVAFATLSHAAGLSSTGDAALDRRLPSTNTIAFRRRVRRRSRPRSRGPGASSRSGRASSGRLNPPPTLTGRCVPERVERADASLAARASVLLMRSSRASINPVKATPSYSERSLTTGRSTVCVLPLRSETIAPMSLETRC
jgi:Queuosine biosynthesis protein